MFSNTQRQEDMQMNLPEARPATAQRLPCQARPLLRHIGTAAIVGDTGVDTSDNDHNTDTEHDIFFVDMVVGWGETQPHTMNSARCGT